MTRWQPIDTAPKLAGTEILGCKFQWDGDRMVMVREPFVTAWSDRSGKFIANPSHWTECPEAPIPTNQDKRGSRKTTASTPAGSVGRIIKALGGNSATGRILGKGPSTVSEMVRRGSIGVEYWPALCAAARNADLAQRDGRKVFELTNDMLADAHAAEGV